MTAQTSLFSGTRWTVPAGLADDSLYRYSFGWIWGPGPLVVYVGLNPSTMTATKIDHTGRKWRGFAERGGFGGYIAVNTHAFRATNPDDLLDTREAGIDIVGPWNDREITLALAHPGVAEVVACWGNPPDRCLNARLEDVIDILVQGCKGLAPLTCWGKTNDGHPRHPLMLPYATPRLPLVAAADAKGAS